jgi:nanoRNase/pAp phosphatase (c-di-AMP/oligoRNAs hydrolase)
MQLVVGHKNTDFDALASMVAVTLLFPEAAPMLSRNINPNVRGFLSIHKDLFRLVHPGEVDLESVQRLLVVDTNRWSRLDGVSALRERDDLEVFLWDHHPGEADLPATRRVHEPMGATITLLVRELQEADVPLTPVQATLFLTGIYEDTGQLVFPATRPEDARAAAWLLEREADLNVVGTLLQPVYGQKQRDVLFSVLRNERTRDINGYRVSFSAVDIPGHVGNLSVVVHMSREILGVDALFGIFTGRQKGKSIVIGRSTADGLNVGTILRSLGGGGHPGAGSAMMAEANPETVVETITHLIEGNQQSSIRIADLMSFPVTTVPPDMTMEALRVFLSEHGITGAPVVEDGRILGVISQRDFKKVRKSSGMEAPVKAFMSPKVVTIDPGASPLRAARMMVAHDIGRLPVVQDGEIIGIVSRSDAMIYFYDLLPE